MTSNGQGYTGRKPDPSTSAHTVPGLGIAQPGYLPRTQSHHGLIENAAPMAASGESQNPFTDPIGAEYRSPDDTWNPQLTGRTLGGFESEMSPQAHHPPADDLRESVYSAWERGAKRATYSRLEDEGDLGTGTNGERDIDTISLDSLQMHDNDHGPPKKAVHGFTVTREVDQDDYDTYKRSLASEPMRHSKPPANVRIGRLSGLSIWLIIMSIYSTIMSAIWLGVAIFEPRWGTRISSTGVVTLSTANLITAILAKTIEMSFVTVFVTFIGQVLTRRAIATKEGMTLSEMSMRTWVTQPGSLLANAHTLKYAGRTLLGVLTLVATVVVIFYTTASDTMVAPKLQFSDWKQKELKSYIKSSYANSLYIEDSCASPITLAMDLYAALESCLDVQNAGNSWPDFSNFMSTWKSTSDASLSMAARPQVKSMLNDNVTVYGTWIETQFSSVPGNFDTHSRIINNVSVAMPHPGVYTAAINETMNSILQPSDLDGIGSYNVSASVISPAVNVLCVNMDYDELKPLVYTAWPNANTTMTGVGNQTKAASDLWDIYEVPNITSTEWLNSTAVDDIFGWGEKYGRRPPVFELYPSDSNLYANSTMPWGSSIYFISKSRLMDNYTVCEVHSWPAIQCSTRFDVSGTTGMTLETDCSQDIDYYPGNSSMYTTNPDAYVHYMNANDTIADSPDWKQIINGWIISLSLDGGLTNSDASVSRMMTEFALREPQLNASLPSMAEALSSIIVNTLVTSAIDTPFIHYWHYNETILPGRGELVTFPARVRSQEYASWHTEKWQGIFYIIMTAAFLLNLLCLAYLLRVGLVKDFLEPTSLFALATASAAALSGARSSRDSMIAKTPEMEKLERKGKGHLVVPYRLAYKQEADHYIFEEAGMDATRGETASGVELEENVGRRSYHRMSRTSFL